MTEKYLKAKKNALKIQRSISNIIWLDGFDNFRGFVTMVSNSPYLSAIELSLYNIFLKPNPTQKELFDLKNLILEENLNISGVHNIFADKDNFKESFFLSKEMFEKTTKRVKEYIDIAKILNLKDLSLDYMDFLKLEELSKEDADKIFINFLREIDKYSDGDVDIHIVPTDGDVRDYLITYVEAIELLKKVNLENIKVLVDLKEIFNTHSMDLKYFRDNKRLLNHIHVSNLDGGPMTFTDIPMHNKIVNISYSKDYTNKFFVMKIIGVTDEQKKDLANYTQFIHVFKEIYQVPLELSPFCSRLFPNLVYRHLSAEGPDIEHLFNYDVH